jgi:hypothetical protein
MQTGERQANAPNRHKVAAYPKRGKPLTGGPRAQSIAAESKTNAQEA